MTIYLDYQATTPLAPEAAAAMRPWLEDKFANPHSSHKLGREAAAAVELAREQVLKALLPPRHSPEEAAESALIPEWVERDFGSHRPADIAAGRLFFTSGATEAANWALKGSFSLLRRTTGRRRIVTVATEHACVLDTVRALEAEGAELVILPVNAKGHIDLDQAREAIDETTAIVAAMLVNNEIGVVGKTAWLGNRAAEVGATMFCDAVQGYGRLIVPVGCCDLIAISGHKIHGPKGIGALWARKGHEPDPFMHGGGQEGGLRSGTLSPALCAGFGAAARVARERGRFDILHVDELYFRARRAFGDDWHVNGARAGRYRGNLNIRRDGVDAGRLISEVREVAFSAGSACASGSGRPSHVLAAIGLSDSQARSSIRLGYGRYTTEAEIDEAVGLIVEAAERQLKFAA